MACIKKYIQFQDRLGWYRYTDWIQENEPAPQIPLHSNQYPCFSLFILASASLPSLLKDTLDSLRAQTYSHWQACVYLGTSDQLVTLKSTYEDEPRIQWQLCTETPPRINLDDESSGDWLGFLNAGDVLSDNGLAIFESGIETHPDATMIYSDTDRLSPDGKTRHTPSFWPDWSPELLLSVNFLNRALFRRDIFIQAFSNARDLEDALLRCTEVTGQVVHIAHMLYHIRDRQDPSWFGDRFQDKNLIAHLERAGLRDIHVKPSPITRASHFTWSNSQPLVSIIIPTRDQVAILKQCVESITSQTTYTHFEIILIENNSQESETFNYYQQLKSNPQVKVLVHDQLFNYSAFNNWGAMQARGDFLLFLNNDIECIDPDWLDEMVRWAGRPEIGVVGAKLLYPDHNIQHVGLVIGLEGHANHVFSGCQEVYSGLFGSTEWYRDYSAVTGACMMLRRSVFEQLGGFDEAYSLAFNDIELCLRVIQAGYRVVYTPYARLVHHEGATRYTYKPPSDIKLASQHLRPVIERGDPFFNPNLSLLRRIPTFHRRGEPSALQKLDQITHYLS